MHLKKIAQIQSGYISRRKIEPSIDGSHLLMQARDVNADRLVYRTDGLVRFNPNLSDKDWVLEPNDILFMARGVRHYSILIKEIPDCVLAAACFFIVRLSDERLLPDYLFWYLNQEPVDRYFQQHSGRGVHMPVVRRSVLEKLDIPLPDPEIQKKIVALETLRKEEEVLIHRLAEKRKELVTASCLKLIHGDTI